MNWNTWKWFTGCAAIGLATIGMPDDLRAQSRDALGPGRRAPARQQTLQDFRGVIQDIREARINGERHVLLELEGFDGRRFLVDLGRDDRITIQLEEGDSVVLRGERRRLRDRRGQQRTLVRAQRLWTLEDTERVRPLTAFREDGRAERRSPRAERPSRQQSAARTQRGPVRAIRGDLAEIWQASVRGSARLVGRVETEQGREYLVDFGSPQRLRRVLQQGDYVVVVGSTVPAGQQRVLIAEQLLADNQRYVLRERTEQRGPEGMEDRTARDRRTAGRVREQYRFNLDPGRLTRQERALLGAEGTTGARRNVGRRTLQRDEVIDRLLGAHRRFRERSASNREGPLGPRLESPAAVVDRRDRDQLRRENRERSPNRQRQQSEQRGRDGT